MFIDGLVRRNAELARAAVELHQRGEVPPSTYIIDLDVLHENATELCREADRLGLSVLAMTKQFGRNPIAIQTLERAGVDGFVAVDVADAKAIDRAGARLGNVGHLVQIPKHETEPVAAMEPDYWTVVDPNKAEEVGSAATAVGRTQPILARVFGQDDLVFESHAGGFRAEEIEAAASALAAIDGCRFAGICSYPALTFNLEKRSVEPTPNLKTMGDVARRLEQAGYSEVEVNAPGVTSTAVLETLADAGATQVEPGHGFTGTTPLHAVAELVERPAIVYLSEISHLAGGSAYCFGGGLYQCIDTIPGKLEALVAAGAEQALSQRALAHLTDYQTIDFYGRLTADDETTISPGDSVVFCFRPQVFYTRAFVAPVSGVAAGEPRVEGLFDSTGRAA